MGNGQWLGPLVLNAKPECIKVVDTFRIVDFHASAQFLGGISLYHDLFALVPDLPGGGLGHAKASARLDTGNPLLGLGHVIHGAKPGAEQQLGQGKDRPSDW